jgi:Ser/Thr protein kinase RdoA (MazF antagonist)
VLDAPAPDALAEALTAYGRRPVGQPEPVEYSMRNQNFRVPTDRGAVFLRFHRRNRSIERLRREHRAIHWAAEQGLPVVPPLPAADGETLIRVGDRVVAAFPWVDGRSPRRRALTVRQAAALGGMHGRLHAVFAAYPDPDLPWIWGGWPSEIDRAQTDLAGCLAALDTADLSADERALVGACLRIQLERLPTDGAARHPDPAAPGSQPVHGDYHERNVLLDGADRLIAVVDWDMVTRMPRAFEVVRCLTYAGLLDPERLSAYLLAYGQHVSLTADESHAAVGYWWRFNLLQSWLYRTRLVEGDPSVQQFFPEHLDLLERFGDPAYRDHLGAELVRFTGAA